MIRSEAFHLKKNQVVSKVKIFNLFLATVFFLISSIRNGITIIVIYLLSQIWTKIALKSKKQKAASSKNKTF